MADRRRLRGGDLEWRTYEPTQATTAHRHAVGLVRADADAIGGFRWICERDLREGLSGRPSHLPDGVVESVDAGGRMWRTAVEVEPSRKTEALRGAHPRAPRRRRWGSGGCPTILPEPGTRG